VRVAERLPDAEQDDPLETQFFQHRKKLPHQGRGEMGLFEIHDGVPDTTSTREIAVRGKLNIDLGHGRGNILLFRPEHDVEIFTCVHGTDRGQIISSSFCTAIWTGSQGLLRGGV